MNFNNIKYKSILNKLKFILEDSGLNFEYLKVIYSMKNKNIQAYPEKVLIACKKGKPCDYGICDECPNVLENIRSDRDDEDT